MTEHRANSYLDKLKTEWELGDGTCVLVAGEAGNNSLARSQGGKEKMEQYVLPNRCRLGSPGDRHLADTTAG